MGIEVGGGQVLYSQYLGNVCLSVLVAGKVSNFSLSNVLYLPGWNNVNLLSWRMINLIGNAYLCGENKTLDIKLKTDNATIVRADLSIHVYSFESTISFGTAYKSSVQFWYEALGHSSPRS